MRLQTLIGILCLLISGGFLTAQSITNQYYNVKANSGSDRYGIRFWNGSNLYKISMGNTSDYKFGPVQDYSIKMGMNNDENRGWTWGINGHQPNAALDTDGNFETALSVKSPTLLAQGSLGRITLKGTNSSNSWQTGQIAFTSQHNNTWYIFHRGDRDANTKRDLAFYHYNGSNWWKYIQLRDNGDSDFEHKGSNRITLHEYGVKSYSSGAKLQTQVQSNGLLVRNELWIRDWDKSGKTSIHFSSEKSGNSSSADAKWSMVKECGTPIMRLETSYPGKATQTVMNLSLADDSDNSHRTGSFHGEWQAQRVKVTSDAWCDYVFDSDYELMPLEEVKTFINKNGHLPNVKSAKQIEEEGGIELGEQVRMLLEKVEELTLYTIELQEEIKVIKNTDNGKH